MDDKELIPIADYELTALINRARLDDKPLSLRALLELQASRSPKREDVIETCASFLDLTAQQIRLIAGELSVQEMRAVRAMLENRAKIIRVLKEK